MICQHCNKHFDATVPSVNVQTYGGTAIYACPHCGQAYAFTAVTRVNVEAVNLPNRKEDDWGRTIRHHRK